MKFFAFVVLLSLAGAHATSTGAFDVAEPAEPMIVEFVILEFFNRLGALVHERNWDPYIKDTHSFSRVLVPRQAEINGLLENVHVSGVGKIEIIDLYYNIIFGILQYKAVFPRLYASLGNGNLNVIYGDFQGQGTASGSLELINFGIGGTAHLTHDYTGEAHIKYINPEFLLGGIDSRLRIVGSVDYSDQVNNFLNNRVMDLYKENKPVVDTILGEALKYVVDFIKYGWN